MDAYVYQAALYCEDCGEAICQRLGDAIDDKERCDYCEVLDASNASAERVAVHRYRKHRLSENQYDSDDYPKGPYADGGGEADCPQHCNSCGVFLENPLTSDGYAYVQEAINDPDAEGAAIDAWRIFYGTLLPSCECNECAVDHEQDTEDSDNA